MSTQARSAWAVALTLALQACSLSYTIERDLLSEINIEHKLLLFDAENDVSIAIDERDKLQRDIRERKRDIRRAEEALDDAVSDASRHLDRGDEAAAELAYMAEDVYELKIDYLREDLGLLRERLAAQDGLIMVALAKYELNKAKLVKKNNVRGAAEIELVDFEEQVDKYVEAAKYEQEYLAEVEAEVNAIKDQWLARRQELESASGGGLGSPWAEDGGIWGGR